MIILGLDLGTTSVGWALINWDESREEGKIIGMGSRIFPEGVTEKEKEPRNKDRRAARLRRRQVRRSSERRKQLGDLLYQLGFLPQFSIDQLSDWQNLFGTQGGSANRTDPYFLRSKGLYEKLEPYEIGKVIYHLNKHRGFWSARVEVAEGEEAKKERGKVDKGINELSAAMKKEGSTTTGAYLATLYDKGPIRGRYLSRTMLKEELEKILMAQQQHYPQILTLSNIETIQNIILHQRPTYWRLKTIGECNLEPDEPLCAKGSWLGQQFEMLQKINNLKIVNQDNRKLTLNEREKLVNLLQSEKSVTFATIRKTMGWIKDTLNLEQGGDKSLPGNSMEADLGKIFGVSWDHYPDKQAIRDQISDLLWEVDYGLIGKKRVEIRRPKEIEESKRKFIEKVQAEWGVPLEQAKKLADISVKPKWLNHSKKAIGRLLPYLMGGLTYAEAKMQAYPKSERFENKILDQLPTHPKAQPDWRNPTVNRALTEVRKVVNSIIREYGKPDLIRIELARDLKLSKKDRDQIKKHNEGQKKKRENAKKEIEKLGFSNPSRDQIEKYLLWEECDATCIYTGKRIQLEDLFRSGHFQVEHILPQSRSLDNAFGNKTLSDSQFNREKGNLTPYEFKSHEAQWWHEFEIRIQKLVKDGKMMRGKALRLLSKETIDEQTDEWSERQLRDTTYIAKKAREFLSTLYPTDGKIHVQPTNGQVTAPLRHLWGLNTILNPNGDKKSRDDHRHHAVDAVVVALSSPGRIQKMSQYYQQINRYRTDSDSGRVEGRGVSGKEAKGSELKEKFPDPWVNFRNDVAAKVDEVIVSHRVQRKVSGPLHEETAYGKGIAEDTKTPIAVTRKALKGITAGQVQAIRDQKIREIVQKEIETRGVKPEKAFPPYPVLQNKDGSTSEIKKVRITEEWNESKMKRMGKRGHAYAVAGSIHHFAIYGKQEPDGTYKEVEYQAVYLFDATKRLRNHKPVIEKEFKGLPLICSLCQGDIVREPLSDGKYKYFRIRKFSAAGQIFFNSCHSSISNPEGSWTSRVLLNKKIKKVSVDPLGRVFSAND